jgi:glyoxalase/bleomycin resistance protein/dioxygenase superfamily protein
MQAGADAGSTKAVIVAAEPQLFVADIKTSCDFFTRKLGFTVAFTYGEPPFYAQSPATARSSICAASSSL